jgi:mRNA degradation ribonuclease J1/J2
VESVVLRDRQTLSSQGIIVAVVILDAHGKPVTPPKILSKGFTFEKNEEEIYEHATKAIESYLIPQRERVKDFIGLKNQIIRKLEDVFYKKGGKEPLIIVEVIQV